MSPLVLSDVVVRARGIARHLLEPETLRKLARSSGPGALVGGLQGAGYWPAPSSDQSALSVVHSIDAAIEHETARRFDVLAHWLGGRVRHFVAVFEDEERRTLRMSLRALAAGASTQPAEWAARGGSRRFFDLAARVTDVASFVRALVRGNHPHAAALAAAHRESGDDISSLERALDRSHAARAHASARGIGGPLLAWVEDGIDLENALDALAGAAGGAFLEGGVRLSRERWGEIAATPETSARRKRLARLLAGGPLAGPFGDPTIQIANLEARTLALRAEAMRLRARRDPLGAAAILEVVMRLRIERSDLRCISWGVAQGMPHDAIVAGLMAVP